MIFTSIEFFVLLALVLAALGLAGQEGRQPGSERRAHRGRQDVPAVGLDLEGNLARESWQ